MARTVLYLHSSAGRYGADRQLYALATGLDPARYRPLVVLALDGPLADDLAGAGVEVIVRPLAVLRRALFSARGMIQVARRAARDGQELGALGREREIALVHTNTSVTLGGVGTARAAGVPHVWHVREIYADFARLWPIYRRVLLRADTLACVSAATCAQFGGDPRARVLHDGVATPSAAHARVSRAAARAALGIPAEVFTVAVLGRISGWKGQQVLARALAQPALAAMGAVGVVAGDAWPGEERHTRDLESLAHELGVDERLRLVGFLEDPETLYAAADVIAVPSTRPDPLPNTALEAAAAGCCVIASAHGGLPEIIANDQTGVLVAPDDAPALAAALERLAGDPELRARLGAAGAADIRARFSSELLLERAQALYDELLAA